MRRHGGKRGLVCQLRGSHGPVLLLKLTSAFPLLPLDSLPLRQRKHLLVLDTQFSALQLKVVHRLNHDRRLLGRGEVGKRQATEDTIVEMVVEGIGQRQAEIGHQLHQLLLLDRKGDVLNDDGGGDQLFVALLRTVGVLAHLRLAHALAESLRHVLAGAQRSAAEAGEGVERRRQLLLLRLIEPSLQHESVHRRGCRAGAIRTAGRALRPRVEGFILVVALMAAKLLFWPKAVAFQPWAPPSS